MPDKHCLLSICVSVVSVVYLTRIKSREAQHYLRKPINMVFFALEEKEQLFVPTQNNFRFQV